MRLQAEPDRSQPAKTARRGISPGAAGTSGVLAPLDTTCVRESSVWHRTKKGHTSQQCHISSGGSFSGDHPLLEVLKLQIFSLPAVPLAAKVTVMVRQSLALPSLLLLQMAQTPPRLARLWSALSETGKLELTARTDRGAVPASSSASANTVMPRMSRAPSCWSAAVDPNGGQGAETRRQLPATCRVLFHVPSARETRTPQGHRHPWKLLRRPRLQENPLSPSVIC